MIVADTGAIIALINRNDRHHRSLATLYEQTAVEWMLPWAILPEVDYLLATHVGARAHDAFLDDLAEGSFNIAWGEDDHLATAHRLLRAHRALRMGLVDAVVITTAIQLQGARASPRWISATSRRSRYRATRHCFPAICNPACRRNLVARVRVAGREGPPYALPGSHPPSGRVVQDVRRRQERRFHQQTTRTRAGRSNGAAA